MDGLRQPDEGAVELETSAEADGPSFPAALRKAPPRSKRGLVVVDASDLRGELQHLLIKAANGEVTYNLDHLLYHPGNDDNWGRIAADPNRDGSNEIDAIKRAAQAHALILQPPEKFGFLSIGAGDAFSVKEAEVIKAHVAQGHEFGFFAYAEINRTFLDKAMEDGRKLAEELGLKDVKHIPLLGDAFSKEIATKFDAEIGQKQQIVAACFGLTLQNIDEKVSGYTEASRELSKKLRALKKLLPKAGNGSRFFSTFNHDTDRAETLAKYTGQVHDDFIMSGVRHHLGDTIAGQLEIKRVFQGSTGILYRDVVAKDDFAVTVEDGETVIVRKGSVVWTGISAPLPSHYVTDAFTNAGIKNQTMAPVRHGAVACHVMHRAP